MTGYNHYPIVPAQVVKPFVKSQKNDTIDAEAIAEAVTRPTMRFTQVRTTEQIDLQALHRIRDQLVSSRTRLINHVIFNVLSAFGGDPGPAIGTIQ